MLPNRTDTKTRLGSATEECCLWFFCKAPSRQRMHYSIGSFATEWDQRRIDKEAIWSNFAVK